MFMGELSRKRHHQQCRPRRKQLGLSWWRKLKLTRSHEWAGYDTTDPSVIRVEVVPEDVLLGAVVMNHGPRIKLIGLLFKLWRLDMRRRFGPLRYKIPGSRLHSDLVVDKALRDGLINSWDEIKARQAANWDLARFIESIGQDHKQFIEGLW